MVSFYGSEFIFGTPSLGQHIKDTEFLFLKALNFRIGKTDDGLDQTKITKLNEKLSREYFIVFITWINLLGIKRILYMYMFYSI